MTCVPGVRRVSVEVVVMAESAYLMSNEDPETANRLEGLEHTLDQISIGDLSRGGSIRAAAVW